MHISNIDYSYNSHDRIEGISKISGNNKVKKEKYEEIHKREILKGYIDKPSVENIYLANRQRGFYSPTEVYLNYINDNRELIYALSINNHPAYNMDDVLGRNIDLIV